MKASQSSSSSANFFHATATSSHAQVSGTGHSRTHGQALRQPMQMPIVDPDARMSAAGQRSNGKAFGYIIKNTFLAVADPAPSAGLSTSASDSDLSRSSEENLQFWMPSLTSSSGKTSSGAADEGEDRDGAAPGRETISLADLVHSSVPTPPQPDPSNDIAVHNSCQRADASDTELPEIPLELPERAPVGKFSGPYNQHSGARGLLPFASTDLQDIPAIVQQIHQETEMPIAELMAAHLICDLSLVPRHYRTGALLSIGTIKHNEGTCRPCTFHVAKSCLRGVMCQFCHCRHREIKVRRHRPPKKTRDKRKLAAANKAEPSADAVPSSDDEEDALFVSQSETSLTRHHRAQADGTNPDQRAEQPVRHIVNPQPNTKMNL